MAIAYVNSTSVGLTGSATGFNFTATSLTAGNLIVVLVRANTSTNPFVSSITDTAGNTYTRISNLSGGGDTSELWYAKNTSGNGSNVVTVTFNGTYATWSGSTAQYSGCDTSSPLDATASATANSTSVTSSSFTTAQADEVIVGASQISQVGGTWTPDTGYTNRVTDSSGVTNIQDKIVSTIQTTVTTKGTCGSGAPMHIHVATFKAAGGAASVGPLTGGGALAHGRLINGGRLVRAPSMSLLERFAA